MMAPIYIVRTIIQQHVEATEYTNHNLEAELIAAVFVNPEIFWEVLDYLPAESVDAFPTLWKKWYALATAIEADAPIPNVDGQSPPAADPLGAARQLGELYQRRMLAQHFQESLKALRDGEPVDDLLTRSEESLASVRQAVKEVSIGRVLAVPDLLPTVLEDIVARRLAMEETGSVAVGLPTGIKRLDKFLGGLQPGLHLMAAEPGMGKTTLALEIAASIAGAGHPVFLVSFEETPAKLALKVVCQQANLDMKQFTDGYGDPAELKRAVGEYGSKLAGLYLMDGTGKLTIAQVKARALQVMSRWRAGRCLIIVDYIQRWASGRREFSEFRHVVSGLVSDLRELSMRLDSPVLAISSQNRTGQGSALLTSLKESGDLEYSADSALFLVDSGRVMTPPHRSVDLVIGKNRYGDIGQIPLIFRPDRGRFKEEARE